MPLGGGLLQVLQQCLKPGILHLQFLPSGGFHQGKRQCHEHDRLHIHPSSCSYTHLQNGLTSQNCSIAYLSYQTSSCLLSPYSDSPSFYLMIPLSLAHSSSLIFIWNYHSSTLLSPFCQHLHDHLSSNFHVPERPALPSYQSSSIFIVLKSFDSLIATTI